MNRKIYTLFALLSLVFVFASCGDDDDNTAEILEWKAQQDQVYRDVSNSGQYSELISRTGNGSVYYKTSNNITDQIPFSAVSPRLIEVTDTPPLFSDSVVCRYMGWYLNSDNEKVVFDGTENMVIDGTEYNFNRQGGVGFQVGGVIAGWSDILQIMYPGNEYEVCIPQQLAYGSSGSGSIKYYTTLFFKLKLLKVFRKQTTDDK